MGKLLDIMESSMRVVAPVTLAGALLFGVPQIAEAPSLGPLVNTVLQTPKPCVKVLSSDEKIPEDMRSAVSKVVQSLEESVIPYATGSDTSKKVLCSEDYPLFQKLLKEDMQKRDFSKVDKEIAYKVELYNLEATAAAERKKMFETDPLYREIVAVYDGLEKEGVMFPPVLTPLLFRAQVTAESTGVVNAISPAGARGLMQMTLAAALSMGVSEARYNDLVDKPYDNLNMGMSYAVHAKERLAEILPKLMKDRSGLGVLLSILGSYNGGYNAEASYVRRGISSPIYESRMYPWRVLGAFKRIAPANLDLMLLKYSKNHDINEWKKFAPDPNKPLQDYIPKSEVTSTIANYLRSL